MQELVWQVARLGSSIGRASMDFNWLIQPWIEGEMCGKTQHEFLHMLSSISWSFTMIHTRSWERDSCWKFPTTASMFISLSTIAAELTPKLWIHRQILLQVSSWVSLWSTKKIRPQPLKNWGMAIKIPKSGWFWCYQGPIPNKWINPMNPPLNPSIRHH